MSNGDPAVIEKRGKSNAARKGRYDGGYTGTEQRLKNRLMNQFRATGEGPGGNSEAYRNASCWCACGRLKTEVEGIRAEVCRKCLEKIYVTARTSEDAMGVELVEAVARAEDQRRAE